MSDQLAFTLEQTIQDRFEEFHAQNPHVYEGLVKLARQARQRGHDRIGIELLFAVLRWEHMMQTTGENGYRLNDHFTARYARKLMAENPDLDGLFETRRLRAA